MQKLFATFPCSGPLFAQNARPILRTGKPNSVPCNPVVEFKNDTRIMEYVEFSRNEDTNCKWEGLTLK